MYMLHQLNCLEFGNGCLILFSFVLFFFFLYPMQYVVIVFCLEVLSARVP